MHAFDTFKQLSLSGVKFHEALASAAFLKSKDQKIIFVDSNTGSDAANRSGEDISSPFATVDYAIGRSVANQGDEVWSLPRHAETVTAAITMDVAGVSLRGIQCGNLRPTITGNGTIDALTVTAANCLVEGFRFAAPGTDAQTADINIAAAFAAIRNCVHIGSTTAKNKVDIITLTAAADDCVIDGVKIYNDVVEVVAGIAIEGALSRLEIMNTMIWDSIGFTNGAVSDEATALALFIHDSTFSNAKADTVVMEFSSNSTGICQDLNINGRHTTLANNITAGTGMNFFRIKTVEEAAVQGADIPAVDTD